MQSSNIDIEGLLGEYKDIISEEHREKLVKYGEFLKPYINIKKTKSMFGQHYENCIWAYDYAVCGPDTCACHVVESYLKEVKKLADFYERCKNTLSYEDIHDFMEEYNDLLLEEHYATFNKHNNFLKKYRTMEQRHTRYGLHYISCSWAYDDTTSGPDTCECIDVIRVSREMMKLMNLYKRLKNK